MLGPFWHFLIAVREEIYHFQNIPLDVSWFPTLLQEETLKTKTLIPWLELVHWKFNRTIEASCIGYQIFWNFPHKNILEGFTERFITQFIFIVPRIHIINTKCVGISDIRIACWSTCCFIDGFEPFACLFLGHSRKGQTPIAQYATIRKWRSAQAEISQIDCNDDWKGRSSQKPNKWRVTLKRCILPALPCEATSLRPYRLKQFAASWWTLSATVWQTFSRQRRSETRRSINSEGWNRQRPISGKINRFRMDL